MSTTEIKKDKTLSVAIMSGKGGVGKSNLSLNIGYALAEHNYSTLLFDCDLGLANLDVLLGISPENTLQDVLENDTDPHSVLVKIPTTNNKNLALLPSASGIPELADVAPSIRANMLHKIEPFFNDYSMLILDLGAGIHENIQYFASMAAIRLIVLTPEPTALTDAYALIKVLSTNLQVKEFLVIVNQAETLKEAKVIFERLETACHNFLDVKPVFLGTVRHDDKVADAVRMQKPVIELFPDCTASKDINELARKLSNIYATMLPHLDDIPLKIV